MTSNRYQIVLRPLTEDEGGGWFAEIPDLPGCYSDGESPQEAITNLEDAQMAWIDTAKTLNRSIPQPYLAGGDYSGKFTIRIAKSLHKELALEAEKEGLSLNQYVGYLLADRHRILFLYGNKEQAATIFPPIIMEKPAVFGKRDNK